MNKQFTKSLYEEHHARNRAPGFSILKEERGQLFSQFIGRGKKVLDLGCRDGALTRFFIVGNDVIGVDIDPVSLSKASELGIETKEMDIYGDWSELEGRKFDVIVAGEVLEHLFHPERVIDRVRQSLVSGGIFIGSVPNAFSLKNRIRFSLGKKKNTPLEDPTHINQFHIEELREILRERFASVEVKGLGRYKKLAQIFPGLFAFDLFFICKND